MDIIGLKFDMVYTNTKSLRYGHVMVMADQDHDGSHIKGLVINFLHRFWPSLFNCKGFICEFITPIVRFSVHPLSQDLILILLNEDRRAGTLVPFLAFSVSPATHCCHSIGRYTSTQERLLACTNPAMFDAVFSL